MAESRTDTIALVAELNDLLQLDHDATRAYTVAIENLENESYRAALRGFRADHDRHIAELGALIREHGGTPIQLSHLTTGLFKLAVQQAGRAGGDWGILLAFETNERQARDKYWRAAERPHSLEVQTVLRRAAEDEERHSSWAIETLRRMGTAPDDVLEQVRSVIAEVQGRAADVLEGAERSVREGVDRLHVHASRARN
jgi:rubrerythrin